MRVHLLWLLLIVLGASAQAQEGRGITNRPDGAIDVAEAVFGHGDSLCDARASLGRECNGQVRCDVRASTRLCGDPARGQAKALMVKYRCGEGRARTALFAEGASGLLDCSDAVAGGGGSSDGPPPGWRRDTIYISEVRYGAAGGYCDATRAFARACDDQARCQVAVGNRLCGDPARNREKGAEISFWCNGRREEGRIREGETAYLSCP